MLVAMRTLLQAAASAEELGRGRLDIRLVAGPFRQWNAVREDARSLELSERERIIRELVIRHRPVGTIGLRELYVAHCRKENVEPVARRTFTKYLNRLGAAGVLNVAA